jgi:hypothetical protein
MRLSVNKSPKQIAASTTISFFEMVQGKGDGWVEPRRGLSLFSTRFGAFGPFAFQANLIESALTLTIVCRRILTMAQCTSSRAKVMIDHANNNLALAAGLAYSGWAFTA